MMFDTLSLPSVFPPRAKRGNVAFVSNMSAIPNCSSNKIISKSNKILKNLYPAHNIIEVDRRIELELRENHVNLFNSEETL